MRIQTIWEVWDYDVWGNAKDGWDVNDRSCCEREYPMHLSVTVNNAGMDREFLSAYPTDAQIRKALGLRAIQLEVEGDDTTIYVSHRSSGMPLGELHCISHESLNPIRN